MNKPLSKFLSSTRLLVSFFFIMILVGGSLFFTLTNIAYAQLSGCGEIDVGNPPANQQQPAACGGESGVVQKVIALARSRINNKNITYVSGQPNRDWATENPNTNDPMHFDCSGFVGWAWYWGSGGKISMLGQTNADWADTSNPHYEKVVTTNESLLQPGDAVYINDHIPYYPQPYHVVLYVGKDTSPSSTCHANDCFMQFYSTGYPGDEESLKASGATIMGYIRMKNP